MSPAPEQADARPEGSTEWGTLGELPGDLMMWVLIVSELLAFGAALLAYLAVRASSPTAFTADQALLDQTAGAVNTLVLVTSGFCTALAAEARSQDHRPAARRWLYAAMALGCVFLIIKAVQYWSKAALGIGIETSPFFTFFYLITGFHALHVVAGIAILGIVTRADSARNIETAGAFWHMVDLIWVLLFPIIYIVR